MALFKSFGRAQSPTLPSVSVAKADVCGEQDHPEASG